jgi:Tfp pilus assembly protein PilW
VGKKMADFMIRYNIAMIILLALVVLFFIFKKRLFRKAQ